MKRNDPQQDDRQLGSMLGGFLSQELDGQTGRALQAFAARANRDPAAPKSRRSSVAGRLLPWGLPLAGSIAAAMAVALALPAWRRPPMAPPGIMPRPAITLEPTNAQANAQEDPQARQAAPVDSFPWTPPPGAALTEVVNIHDVDDGMLLADGQVPMRKLRRETLQRVSWLDKRHQTTVEMIVPREQVVLVAVHPF